ncbi:MAG: hypothetical protein RIC06_04190 [Cyclobacteriaceae bacterium]
MKLIVTILFSLLILSSSGGMVLAKHFCGGELVETAFFKKLDSCCDGMEERGCCDTEQHDLKHDENTPVSIYSFTAQVPVLMYVFEIPSLSEIISPDNFIVKKFLQKPLTVPDIFARNQSFLL